MLSRNDAGKGHWKKAGDLGHEAGGLADGVDDVTSLPVTVGNDEFGREGQVTIEGKLMLKRVYQTQVYNQGNLGARKVSLFDEKAYKSPMKPYKPSMKTILESECGKQVGVQAYKLKTNGKCLSSTPPGGV